MLEYERATLVTVTIQARLFVSQGLRDHWWAKSCVPSGSKSAVRIVAIGALHEPFIDTVFEGHGKLRPYRRVALVTKFALVARQQKLSHGRLMNGVAI